MQRKKLETRECSTQAFGKYYDIVNWVRFTLFIKDLIIVFKQKIR